MLSAEASRHVPEPTVSRRCLPALRGESSVVWFQFHLLCESEPSLVRLGQVLFPQTPRLQGMLIWAARHATDPTVKVEIKSKLIPKQFKVECEMTCFKN